MEHIRRNFKHINPAWFLAILAVLVADSCSAPPPSTQPPAVVSFARDILPVLDQSCLKCHGGDKTEKGLSVKPYEALMQGSQKGSVVVPGDPEASRLAQLLLNGKMPKRWPKLSQGQIELVLDWIRAGAQNN